MFLSSLSEPQKKAFICLAHDVVVSDGELAPGEMKMMEEMRREMDLPGDVEAHYLPIDGVEDIFDTKRVRAIVVIALVRLSYADGAYDIEERCFLDDLRRALAITETEFNDMQAWVRKLVTLEHDVESFLR